MGSSVSTSLVREDSWLDQHPFITFNYDLRRLDAQTWVLLGECSSKIQHILGVPLRPDTSQELHTIYLAKGVHATTAIEGNTLTEAEVEKRMQGKLDLPKSRAYLGIEIDNIVRAYEYLVQRIVNGVPAFLTADDLKLMNQLTLTGLEVEEGVVPGEFRNHTVGVHDYRAPDKRFVDRLVDQLCHWMNEPSWRQTYACPYVLPILQSIFAHLYIAWIHPFGDGNGRTARLIEFDTLTRAGVPVVSAHVLADHYNKTRAAYYRALSRARQDPAHFVRYAVEGFADGLRDQLTTIRDQQIHVAWLNFVHEEFQKDPSSEATTRRREIAIALAGRKEPVAFQMVPTLTENLQRLYSTRSTRAVDRDLVELLKRDLIEMDEEGSIRPKTDRVLAFLPLVNPPRATEGTQLELSQPVGQA